MRVTFDEQPSDQDLQHFGVKGMKWGVRRKIYKAMAKDRNLKDKQDKEFWNMANGQSKTMKRYLRLGVKRYANAKKLRDLVAENNDQTTLSPKYKEAVEQGRAYFDKYIKQ